VRSAFAIENVARFSGAFAFALVWLVAAANVNASLIATDNLLFGRNDMFLLSFCHFQVPLVKFWVSQNESLPRFPCSGFGSTALAPR
jgi:hypothetical protein